MMLMKSRSFCWTNVLLCRCFVLEGIFSGLRECLATESLLKIIKRYFIFHLKGSFRS